MCKRDMMVTCEPGMIFWIKNPRYFNKEGRHLFLIIGKERNRDRFQTMQINTRKTSEESLPICLKNGYISYISTNEIYSFEEREISSGSFYGIVRNDDFIGRDEILEICMEAFLYHNGINVSNTHFGNDAVNYYKSNFKKMYSSNVEKEVRDHDKPRTDYIDPSKPLTSKIKGLEAFKELLPTEEVHKDEARTIKVVLDSCQKKDVNWGRFKVLMNASLIDLNENEVDELAEYFRHNKNNVIVTKTGLKYQSVANKRYYLRLKRGVDTSVIKK